MRSTIIFGFSHLNEILTQGVCFHDCLLKGYKSVKLQRYGCPYFQIVIQNREHFRIKGVHH